MPELNEPRVREIVRDELSIMQVSQKLSAIMERINNLVENKADKSDVEELKGEIKTLKVEQKLTRYFLKYNSRLMIGFFISILTLLIGLIAGVVNLHYQIYDLIICID